MMRIGMMLAVVGGVLLAPEAARACERHAGAARPAAAEEKGAGDTSEKDAALAAKCQCGSAADCTCKKGECRCTKCKKPRREAVAPLKT